MAYARSRSGFALGLVLRVALFLGMGQVQTTVLQRQPLYALQRQLRCQRQYLYALQRQRQYLYAKQRQSRFLYALQLLRGALPRHYLYALQHRSQRRHLFALQCQRQYLYVHQCQYQCQESLQRRHGPAARCCQPRLTFQWPRATADPAPRPLPSPTVRRQLQEGDAALDVARAALDAAAAARRAYRSSRAQQESRTED